MKYTEKQEELNKLLHKYGYGPNTKSTALEDIAENKDRAMLLFTLIGLYLGYQYKAVCNENPWDGRVEGSMEYSYKHYPMFLDLFEQYAGFRPEIEFEKDVPFTLSKGYAQLGDYKEWINLILDIHSTIKQSFFRGMVRALIELGEPIPDGNFPYI